MADESTTHKIVPVSEFFDECSAHEDTEIDRQLPRNEFRGSASATIYPRDGETAEPVHCTVLMRDLSRGGFGIAHTEMLLPRQRIELVAATKRLVGEVQWCRQIQHGFYIAGCRLIASE